MHKIKNEKHVGLVLALQKVCGGESVINEVFYFSLCIEWFILQHDYSKVSENNSRSEEKVHTDPTGAIAVVVIFVRN